MAAASGAEARPARARLDPLALPSDTPFRFALLVAAVLGSTLYVFDWLYVRHGGPAQAAPRQEACVVASDAAIARAVAGGTGVAAPDCLGIDRSAAWWMLGGCAAVLLAALAVYLALPLWRMRREHLLPLPVADIPGLGATLDELGDEAHLSPPPAFLMQPLRAAPGGLAFGRAGRRYVALSGGLVATFITDPPLFRGILRHELSHLRNRDLDQTYGAVAIVIAFVLLAAVPFTVSAIVDLPVAPLDVVLRFGLLGAFVALTFAAVLRSRELFADAAAAEHDAEGGLRRALSAPAGRRPRVAALALHPPTAERLRALDDPEVLFTTSPWTAFGAGFAAALAFETVQFATLSLSSDGELARHVAALTFAPLTAAVAGFGIWRDAYRAVRAGRSGTPTLLAGLALGAGIVAGRQVSIQNVVTGRVLSQATLERVLSGWSLATLVACVLIIRWLWGLAVLAQRSALAERAPRLAATAAAGLASLVLWLLFELLLLSQTLYDAGAVLRAGFDADYAAAGTLVPTEPRPLWTLLESNLSNVVTGRTSTLLVVIALAAGPFALAAVIRDGRIGFPAALRPLRATAAGLAAGLAAVATMIAARGILKGAYTADERSTIEFALGFQHLLYGTAIVAGMLAAVAAALLARAHRVVHGLLAALVCAVVFAVGNQAALLSLAGCVPAISFAQTPVCGLPVDWDGTWLLVRIFAGASALPALVAAGVVAAAAQVRGAAADDARWRATS